MAKRSKYRLGRRLNASRKSRLDYITYLNSDGMPTRTGGDVPEIPGRIVARCALGGSASVRARLQQKLKATSTLGGSARVNVSIDNTQRLRGTCSLGGAATVNVSANSIKLAAMFSGGGTSLVSMRETLKAGFGLGGTMLGNVRTSVRLLAAMALGGSNNINVSTPKYLRAVMDAGGTASVNVGAAEVADYPTFTRYSGSSVGSADCVVTFPAAAAGDMIVVQSASQASQPAAPSGFTSIGSGGNGLNGTRYRQSYKVAVGGETSVTSPHTSDQLMDVVIVKNVDTSVAPTGAGVNVSSAATSIDFSAVAGYTTDRTFSALMLFAATNDEDFLVNSIGSLATGVTDTYPKTNITGFNRSAGKGSNWFHILAIAAANTYVSSGSMAIAALNEAILYAARPLRFQRKLISTERGRLRAIMDAGGTMITRGRVRRELKATMSGGGSDSVNVAPAAPTTISYVGAGAVQSSTSFINIPAPAGMQVGDTLIAIVESANETIATPSGWTLLHGATAGVGGNTLSTRVSVFKRTATSTSDACSISDTGIKTIGVMLAFRNLSAFNAYDAITATASGTSLTGPATDAAVAKSMLLWVFGFNGTQGTNTKVDPGATTLTNITKQVDVSGDVSAPGSLVAVTAVAPTIANYAGPSIINSVANTNRIALSFEIRP